MPQVTAGGRRRRDLFEQHLNNMGESREALRRPSAWMCPARCGQGQREAFHLVNLREQESGKAASKRGVLTGGAGR